MRVGILRHGPDLSLYVGEMLQTWGLTLYDFVDADGLDKLDPAAMPVLLCPTHETGGRDTAALLTYAQRGGTVVCFLPKGELAAAAGLVYQSEKVGPLRLRSSFYPVSGLGGELLPIVGPAATYACQSAAHTIAYLSHPGRYHDESVGAVQCPQERGRIVAFAFDLPLCVLYLRQGDPARAEYIPAGDGCARPSHMAADLGPSDAAWVPFADLLARFLVDLVRRYLPAPVPLFSHLPDMAPGILLYSGDEDGAEVAANEDEFAAVHQAGGRMNLYIIPDRTLSTRQDAMRYAQHHDLGPHPNLRPLDGEPIAARLAQFRQHIELFQEHFGLPARSLRNHCTAWAGYLEPVEIMEELGVGMDGNYFSGTYMRDRMAAPYAGFGAAMPMRFCAPEGRLFNVFQQHTHLSDDVIFGDADYSYKLSPQNFAPMSARILTDVATRFHTPYTVCIHPGNWVKYSQDQGRALLDHASERDLPIWSFDQWLNFWEARHTWRFIQVFWDGATLQCSATGDKLNSDLRLVLPLHFEDKDLNEVLIGGKPAPWQPVQRYHERIALIDVRGYGLEFTLTARYLKR
jgi:hypothetical protein